MTNVFFNNYNHFGEQNLIEDLIIESIRIYGMDIFYVPRTTTSRDSTFNEDDTSEYKTHYLVEVYIKNVEAFEGEGDFLSKFNVQLRDEITFTMARRVYANEIGQNQNDDRPLEGDLIYVPMLNGIYKITFVEHESIFYQMGALQTYDLRCEKFEYSHEKFDTGIPAIDNLETKYSLNAVANTETGFIDMDEDTGKPVDADTYTMTNDPMADNDEFQSNANTFIDWSEMDPFSGGNF
jgi:hypothetical protein